jgi:N-acetylglucosaminyldiphosphoundecaprenol N-acetyl-beta-D-mannosaminyltransferase
MRRDSYLCCGVRIDGIGPESAVLALLDSRYGVGRGAHLCNSYTLALALRDHDYRRDLNTGHLNLADGHYVAMVGRWHRQKDLTARVYGPDLMLATMDRGRPHGMRHYLYGATPETVTRLARSLSERFPGVEIVGIEAPPFRGLQPDEEVELAARIAQARPDILWVGTGTPRQDHFVAQYTERLACTVVPVGAAFDFHSGNTRPAPEFIKRIGFEWLFRFALEPRRLWRRYLIGIPVFIFGVVTDLARRTPSRPQTPIRDESAVPAPRSRAVNNGRPAAAGGVVEVRGSRWSAVDSAAVSVGPAVPVSAAVPSGDAMGHPSGP